jgi:hypothetical protein
MELKMVMYLKFISKSQRRHNGSYKVEKPSYKDEGP